MIDFPITVIMLHVECDDVGELRGSAGGEGGELVPGQRDGAKSVQ